MSLLKSANLALAFLLELVALGAFAYFGFTATDTPAINIVLAIAFTVVAIVLWGLFAAPRSERRLRGRALIAFKVVFFALACGALVLANNLTLGIVLAVLTAINLLLAYIWKQETL